MARLDGRPSSGLSTYLLPGANALDTADRIKARMRELETRFPAGLNYAIVYDTTPFVRESVNQVFHTLIEAIILVTVVVLLFLQDWKSVLLPMIGVVVSLVGTFTVMSMMGFTLNNLTLFGLVLAIGIVVDDAIVVLENIERRLEKGLSAREATIKAMDEITGPIFAITLVLSCSVAAQRVSQRPGRPVLSPVCRDYIGVDDHLGDQRNDDDPGAGRPVFR